uniref:C2HC/C3H-type domain-containing protein n=1 Tax=Clastoptera arizonana TaxID=38151 RepID=A0A1B6EA23_9HEMI
MSVRVRSMARELNTPSPWPKVKKLQIKPVKLNSNSLRQRPDTATLEKPLMLDPALLRKLDMTRTTRERLMTIENLVVTPKKKNKARIKDKPPIAPTRKEMKSNSWEDDSVSDEPKTKKMTRVLNTTFRIKSHARKSLKEVLTLAQDTRPTSTSPVPKKTETLPQPEVTKKTEFVEPEVAVPAPCCACGRKERPERLHAHPKRVIKKKTKDDQENKEQRSVTKPIPMKFRSGKSREKSDAESEPKKETALIRKETFKVERGSRRELPVVEKKEAVSPRSIKAVRSPLRSPECRLMAPKNPVVHSASRRPRTVVCYLCSKEFFTASFPLHEPHCLQKWQRENEELPTHLQMPLPQKPEVPVTSEEWNRYAWETAQAVLVPCQSCGRTFLPTRLEAHQRACTQTRSVKKPSFKPQVQDWDSEREDKSDHSDRIIGPPNVHCHICGRMFTNASINIHEEHCLKRWQQENRVEKSVRKSPPPSPMSSASNSSTQSTPRRRFVICYVCGRQFGSKSIEIHTPQCLKKWHVENEKLPPSQRRQEPQKPEVVYDTDTGKVDMEATIEAQWQTHLVQLVPCGKCGRTFNPDRVAVHERCCKGPADKK